MLRRLMPGLAISLVMSVTGRASGSDAKIDTESSTDSLRAGFELPLSPLRSFSVTTNEGTWMSLDVSPDGRLIAFDLLGKIFTLPIRGGKATQLTTGPAFDEWPRFSRDGRYVLFSSDRGGAIQVWRVPVEGGATSIAPKVDRAGIPMALEINRANSDPATWSAISLKATNKIENPISSEAEIPTIWSPDGRYGVRSTRPGRAIMYATEECQSHAEASFLLVERATGETRRLAAAGPDCGDMTSMPLSAFTPDGRAFITAYGGKIWRIEIPSGETNQIPFTAEVQIQGRPRQTFSHRISDDPLVHARVIEHARLSPNGSQVAFGAFNRLWVQTLPKGTPHRLTQLDIGEFQPVWSPDGRYVAFVTWADEKKDGAIWRIRVHVRCLRTSSCPAERLTTEPGRYMHLAYSPDGRRIAALQVQAGGRFGKFAGKPVWIPAAGGGTLTVFGKDRDVGVEYTSLYFTPDDPERLFEIQASAEFLQGPPRSLGPRCVVNRWALAGSSREHAESSPVLIVKDAPRAKAPWNHRFGFDYDCAAALSPQGDRVVFRKATGELYLIDLPENAKSGPQIVTLNLVPEKSRRISPEGLGGNSPNWSADGRTISFTFGHTLYLYNLERARVESTNGARAYVPQAIPIDVAMPRDLPTGTTVFRNARLITMRGDEIIERGDLVVRGRRIAALGQSGAVDIPANARVVDARGATIIPGLLDLHNHVNDGFVPHVHDSQDRVLESNLAFGVLNSRDPQGLFTDVLTIEDLIEAGKMLGPRVQSTFVGIGLSSGEWIDSMERARSAVRRYGETGLQVSYIKEYLSGPRHQRQFLIMAAAEENLNVTSHGTGLRHLLTNAIDGYGGFDHSIVAVPLYDDVLQLLAVTQIPWAENNWRWGLYGYFMTSLTSEEREKLRRLYKPTNYGGAAGSFESILLRVSRIQRAEDAKDRDRFAAIRMAQSLAAAIKRGARITNGSHGDVPGFSTHVQVWAYVEGGASPLEALRTSTLWSAEALDRGQDLGSLEVGKLADLVVLDKNPLDRIQNTIAIRYVMFNGHLYEADTLTEVQ